MSNQNTIVLIMAMQEEAQAIVDHFNAKKLENNDINNIRYEFYSESNDRVILSINGVDEQHKVESVGTQPAAINTLSSIREFKPSLVVNAGTAGGFKERGTEIGDIFLAINKIFFHDRRIPLTPEYENYGIGGYSCPTWMNEIAKQLSAKTGIVCTSDAFDLSPTDKKQMQRLEADVKEMEAASIAYVCQKLNTPLLVLKSITDLVDVPISSDEQFMKNLTKASTSLKNNLIKLFSIDFQEFIKNAS